MIMFLVNYYSYKLNYAFWKQLNIEKVCWYVLIKFPFCKGQEDSKIQY